MFLKLCCYQADRKQLRCMTFQLIHYLCFLLSLFVIPSFIKPSLDNTINYWYLKCLTLRTWSKWFQWYGPQSDSGTKILLSIWTNKDHQSSRGREQLIPLHKSFSYTHRYANTVKTKISSDKMVPLVGIEPGPSDSKSNTILPTLTWHICCLGDL